MRLTICEQFLLTAWEIASVAPEVPWIWEQVVVNLKGARQFATALRRPGDVALLGLAIEQAQARADASRLGVIHEAAA